MDTSKSDSNAPGAATGWILLLGVIGLLLATVPLTVAAAALALCVLAVWMLFKGHTDAAVGQQKTGTSQDEDLGLPPPKSVARSGAASRKVSVAQNQASSAGISATAAATTTPRGLGSPSKSTKPAPADASGAAAAAAAAASSDEPFVVLEAANKSPEKAALPAAVTSRAVPAAPSAAEPAAPALAAAPAAAASQQTPAATGSTAAAAAAAAAEQPVALTGSAAILAKLRSQRQSTSIKSTSGADAAAAAQPVAKVTVLYASQTGTGQEIARTIHAECAAKGMQAEVMSFNELSFDNLTPVKTPVVVFVASSTGDGDPPDNAAAAYVALKKPWPADRLAGIRYTVLGLGDSNYTRFMHVPRAVKNRFQDLGGVCFYKCVEADEVDGLEDTVDPWCEGLYGPLQAALQELQQQPAAAAAAAAADSVAAVPVSAGAAADEASRVSTPAAASRQMTGTLSNEQSTALLTAVMRGSGGDDDDTAAAGAPRVQMELSAVSEPSGLLPGQAVSSLLDEDSAISQAEVAAPPAAPQAAAAAAPPAEAPAAVPAAAIAAAAAIKSPPSTPPVQLVDGLAPAGVDLKGVPPLAPCRITLNQQLSPSAVAAAKAREAAPSMDQKFYRDPTGTYSADAPFWATVSDARLMTADWSDRTVIHMELDISDSGMRYNAGDAVGVLAQNAAPLVSGLLARLGLDGDSIFEVQSASGESTGQGLLTHIPSPCSLRYAFTNCTDLTSVPRKSLLRLLAEHCSDADEQRTLLFFTSRAGREAYASEITAGQPSLLDLLRRFPSCKPPVDALLDALPPLAPRMYSLTCAPVAAEKGADGQLRVPGACGPNRLQFALSVVEFETKYGVRRGVATNWLAKLCRPWLAGEVGPGTDPTQLPQVWVPIFLRRAGDFKPPASLSTPMVMIGPGTGVAPFRGFLQQRLADMQASGDTSPGAAVLYFGCRKAEEDYLYEEDWQALQAAGVLQTLRTAFSRAQASKVYVQHLMKEDSKSLAKLAAAGAHVYVCGDGAGMAKDVHAALVAVLRDELGMSEVQAGEELQAMAKAGRYVRDIWS